MRLASHLPPPRGRGRLVQLHSTHPVRVEADAEREWLVGVAAAVSRQYRRDDAVGIAPNTVGVNPELLPTQPDNPRTHPPTGSIQDPERQEICKT